MPTLEKELWQSVVGDEGCEHGSCRHWKRNCGKANEYVNRAVNSSCRHWKRNCGKAIVPREVMYGESCRHWKRNCGKACRRRQNGRFGLADTGKGTVAKPRRRHDAAELVLPTLEKELWQSTVANQAARRMSCRHWKRNCGKADVGNCTTIRGVMSNFATDFGWILGRMGNLRGLRGEWPRGGVESVCGWVVKDRGRCTVRIG